MQIKGKDQADRKLTTPSSAPEVVERTKARDGARQQRFAKIIAAKGWPTTLVVGWEAADAAWLIAQHADDQPEFQKSALALMEQEASKRGGGRSTKTWRIGLTESPSANAVLSSTAHSLRYPHPEPVEARWQGNDDGSGATLHTLAEEFGVSAERIRQIGSATLKKTQGALAAFV